MSVLDTIDTTVSLEFGETRTVGTLLELSGQMAVLTALALPEEGGELNVVIEGDEPDESVTVDGICLSVSETAWGEKQAEVEILRVGTTCSASRLRDFIEQYEIARGGSVHIGQNRDSPNSKRFVYHVPDRLDGVFMSTNQGGIATRKRKSTVQFPGKNPPPRAKSEFKSTDQMHGGGGGFQSTGALGVDLGFDAASPDRTMPDQQLDPRIFEAAGFNPEPGFDIDVNGPTNPDRTLNTDMGSVGFSNDADLDAALREALAAVDSPRLPDAPKAKAAGTGSTELFALDLPEEPEPTKQLDAVSMDAVSMDTMGAVGDVFDDNLDLDAFADFGDLDDPLEPTAMLDALPDEPEPTRQMDVVPETTSFATPSFAAKPSFQIPGTSEPDDLGAASTTTTDSISAASLMADHDDDDDDLFDDEPEEALSDEEAERLMRQVDQAIAFERAVEDSEYYDPNEQIVVNTVAAGVPFADPVKLGNDNKAPSLRNIAPAESQRRPASQATKPAPVTPPSNPHRRMPSDALQKVQSVFTVDFALRAELAVQFQIGRKKYDGTLLRLAESRMRIRTADAPNLYELINVLLPPPPGEKRKVSVRCEVTRIREPEGSDEVSFDMRVSGGNSPKTMIALRALIQSFEAPHSQAATA